MSRPTTRTELLSRMTTDLDALLAEVDRVHPDDLTVPGVCGQWSVKDLLAHLDAWRELFLTWEAAGRVGAPVDLPAPGFTWKQTPALNDVLWQRHRDDPLGDVLARLRASQARMVDTVAAYGDEELFARGRYAWTGTTSVGSYAVSASTSHDDWARRLVRRARTAADGVLRSADPQDPDRARARRTVRSR